jgi:two-component system, response regulator YesN
MPIKGAFTPYDLERFEKAINHIQQNYKNNSSAENLAMEVCINVKLLQLGVLFLTGTTIHNYRLKIRVEKAQEDLTDFRKPIKYIARQHGFSSSSHFDKVFKRNTGQTPNQYRSQFLMHCEQN